MFGKLRAKFVAIITISVAVVVAVVFTTIVVVDHQRSIGEVQEALSSSLDRSVSSLTEPFEFRHNDMGVARFAEEAPGGPRIGGHGEDRSMVPVAVYLVNADSSYTSMQKFASATIDEDVLASAIEKLSSADDGSGTIDELGLHYDKRTLDEGTLVAFADTTTTSGWKQLALSLFIAGLGIVLAFAVIGYFLSNWALRPVKEAWDSQRQFVADASHELKTPLTVMLANNSILLKHPGSTIASQSQWIESSQVEAERMQGLINEMLELAQVESRAAAVREQVDFSDLVDGIGLQFESVAFERGCELECEIQEGINVEGDANRLSKAVSTLVENALKYVDEGGRVDVRLTRAGRNAQLVITNTGSVISEEDLPHIFDRFYRTDKARTSGAGGFGLGLAIAREIAREHGGDIACKSDAASGTTFTMTIATC